MSENLSVIYGCTQTSNFKSSLTYCLFIAENLTDKGYLVHLR
ncbi:MAG: hypothetical protein ACPG7X_02685 [Flavobacteriaceae bacterium]